MTLGLTEQRILAAMASGYRGVYSVTTGPARSLRGERTGRRELTALNRLVDRGYATEILREADRDNVRGARSRVGKFVTVTAKITPEGRAAHEALARR